MGSRREKLAEAFYLWEDRGRGYHEWSDRVCLEPLFTPFWGHNLYVDNDAVSEGRDPGYFEKLYSIFKQADKPDIQYPETDPLEELEYPETPPGYFIDSARDTVEYSITLPHGSGGKNNDMPNIITDLTASSSRLSFEIIGTADSLVLILAVPACEARHFESHIHSQYPDLGITKTEKLLESTWLSIDTGDHSIVSFGLDQEFLKPIESHAGSSDTISGLYRILGILREGQVGIFQVIISPCRAPWIEHMIRASQTVHGESFFSDDSDIFNRVKTKVRTPLYSTLVRIGVRSYDERSCFELTRNLAQTLNHIQTPGSNSLIPLENELVSEVDQQVDLILRMTHRSGMILNEDEVNLLAQFPSSRLSLGKLKRFERSTNEAPEGASAGLYLGKNIHRNVVKDVLLPESFRSSHMHVIGATGSGKSNLLLSCIQQDISKGHGVCVIEPHGDLIDTILKFIPEHRLEDVILVDPSDVDFPIAFNILKAHSELDRNLIASDFTSIIASFSTSWGDQMQAVMENALLAILNHPEGGTLRDLQRLLIEKSFRETFLEKVTDDQVVYYWKYEFPLLRGQPQASIITRLSMFLRPKPIRNMVLQKENIFDFEKIMDNQKILLIKLSHGLIGESNAHLLGAFLVSKINQSVMARQAKDASKRTPYYLYIDEFHNFACKSMTTILESSRKYAISLTLAHQELKQVETRDPALTESLLSNAYSKVCFRLGDRDAKRLENSFSHFSSHDLQNLDIGNAVCRFGPSVSDFNLETERFEIPSSVSDSSQRIIDNCRSKYATSRSAVEESLAELFKGNDQPKVTKKKKEATTKIHEVSNDIEPTVKEQEKPASLSQKNNEDILEPATDSLSENVTSQTTERTPQQSEPLIEKPHAEETGNEKAEIPHPSGIGGDEHRKIQAHIKKLAEGFGYKVQVEQQISGRQLVDVGLEKRGKKIAIEVSVTTPTAKEILNITKSLNAGYESVIMTSPNPKTLSLIRKRAQEKLTVSEFKAVTFLMPDQIASHFVDLEAQAASCVEDVMGWEVETIYTNSEKLGKEQKAVQEAAMSQLAKKIERSRQRKKN